MNPHRVAAQKAPQLPRVFIHCTGGPTAPVFAPFAAKARSRGWAYHEIAAGHEVILTAPDQVAAILLDVLSLTLVLFAPHRLTLYSIPSRISLTDGGELLVTITERLRQDLPLPTQMIQFIYAVGPSMEVTAVSRIGNTWLDCGCVKPNCNKNFCVKPITICFTQQFLLLLDETLP